ncbi:hypothetical protein ACP70R_036058 [Stipagrostis hirtigluma subsp. patula]
MNMPERRHGHLPRRRPPCCKASIAADAPPWQAAVSPTSLTSSTRRVYIPTASFFHLQQHSSCPSLPVNLRWPKQQPPAARLRFIAPLTNSAASGGGSLSSRCELKQSRRRRRSHVVASATTTESVVGDMERGALAEKSGRSDGQVTARWREIHGGDYWAGLLDPIDTVLCGELIRCRYPAKTFFHDLGLGGVGYEVSRYLYATSNVKLPNFSNVKHKSAASKLWSETATFIGFVAVSTDEETARIGRRDIAVAWRGTVTRLEWVADLTATPRPVSEFGIPCPDPRVKVESGFAELYTGKDPACRWCRYSAREQVLAEVRKLVALYHGRGEEVSVTVTGHSLGSALAMLSAYDVAETAANVSGDGRAAPVCVFSFSGPRVGNPRFKDRFERELGVHALRILNVHDTVPKVPGVFYVLDEKTFPEPVLRLLDDLGVGAVYTHAGVELALDHTVSPYLKETLDLACYHNLEAHLHLLDGYRGRGRGFELCGRDPALVNKAADFLRDEHMVPPQWRQDENKGMVRTEDGRWVLPPRDRDVDDLPEDTDHHLEQIGLTAAASS